MYCPVGSSVCEPCPPSTSAWLIFSDWTFSLPVNYQSTVPHKQLKDAERETERAKSPETPHWRQKFMSNVANLEMTADDPLRALDLLAFFFLASNSVTCQSRDTGCAWFVTTKQRWRYIHSAIIMPVLPIMTLSLVSGHCSFHSVTDSPQNVLKYDTCNKK